MLNFVGNFPVAAFKKISFQNRSGHRLAHCTRNGCTMGFCTLGRFGFASGLVCCLGDHVEKSTISIGGFDAIVLMGEEG